MPRNGEACASPGSPEEKIARQPSETKQKELEAEVARLQVLLERERALRLALEFQLGQLRHRLVDSLNSFISSETPRLHRMVKVFFIHLINWWQRRKGDKYQRLQGAVPTAVPRSGPGSDPRPDLPLGVNVAGYARSEKGVGESLRAAIRALEAVQVPYVINPLEDLGSTNTENSLSCLSSDNPYAVNLVYLNPDAVASLRWQRNGYFRNRKNVGCWNWELQALPPEWRSGFEGFDEAWVPSTFVQEAVARSSSIPVVRIPYPVNPEPELESGYTRAFFGIPSDSFVFLHMFDFHSIAERKNPTGAIRAFKRAFGNCRDVFLLVKCARSEFAPRVLAKLRDEAAGANVGLYEGVLPGTAVYNLMSLCDCYVSLHRSEGFGLTLLEAMSLAKPVIATGYSGNMDFTTPDNSFLVGYRLVEIEKDFGPYKKGCLWADPDLDQAAEIMRQVEANRPRATAVGRQARDDVRRDLHPSVVGRMMRERLLRLIQRSGG